MNPNDKQLVIETNRRILNSLCQKTLDIRKYTPLKDIISSLNQTNKRLISSDFILSENEICKILNETGFNKFNIDKQISDSKVNIMNYHVNEVVYDIDLSSINNLRLLKDVYTRKSQRREDRQIILEKKLSNYYTIILDYFNQINADNSEVLTTLITEPLLYKLRLSIIK